MRHRYNIKPVTFKQFMQILPTVHHEQGQTAYESLSLFNPPLFGGGHASDYNAIGDEVNVKRNVIELMKGPEDQVLKMHLMKQAKTTHLQINSLETMLNDACLSHMYEYGVPTHAVRLSKRIWMVANPQDFRIVRNDQGVALACIRLNRTLVYFVGRK